MPSLNKGFAENFLSKLKSLDWFIITLVMVISVVSLIVLSSLDTSDKNLVEKHFIRIIFSFIIFLIAASVNIKTWYKFSYYFYALVILLLILVDFYGLVGRGAKRWLDVGIFNLQPSELMKIAVIMALARYYQYIKTDEIDKIRNLVIPISLIIIPFVLVIKATRFRDSSFYIISCDIYSLVNRFKFKNIYLWYNFTFDFSSIIYFIFKALSKTKGF